MRLDIRRDAFGIISQRHHNILIPDDNMPQPGLVELV
jgi:hypothetical protein